MYIYILTRTAHLSLKDWRAGTGHQHGLWTCQVCNDFLWREPNKARRHERQEGHQEKVKYYSPPESGMNRHVARASRAEEVIGPLTEVLTSWESAGGHAPSASSPHEARFPASELSPGNDLDMDVIMDAFADDFSSSADLAKAHMSQTLLDYMNGQDVYTESEPEDDSIPTFDDFPTGTIFFIWSSSQALTLLAVLFGFRKLTNWRYTTSPNKDDA